MTQGDWKRIGVYAAIVILVSMWEARIALALVAVFTVAALIRNSKQLADWLGRIGVQ